MKILQIVDVPYWAIGHLSESIIKYNRHLEFQVLYVHPKHVEEHLAEVSQWIEWADVIDYQYWNTCKQLLELLPELKNKKSILTHHNEKDLLSGDWSDIHKIVAETKYSQKILEEKYSGKVRYIPLAIDLSEFTYKPELRKDDHKPIIGYVGRVVPWKGLKEIAEICYELGYELRMMGKFDKPDYWDSIDVQAQANINLDFLDCKDDERKQFYKEIDIYVGFSGPGRETGTLPLMEAMASGVPVITTPSGIAADICEDQENALVTPFGDREALKNNLRMLASNLELQEKVRRNAWNTIKNYTEAQRAWEYEKLYHEVYDPINPLVSVIIPTTPEKGNQTREILQALSNSDYKHIEAVVIMDQTNELVIIENPLNVNKSPFDFPVKFLTTDKIGGYNLAMARNMGVIEAQGKYLLFCDNRMKPDPAAISLFVNRAEGQDDKNKKVWWYGNKGTGKRTFVENFSFIRRDHFIRAGMFNERIDRYGGMSQEVRQRFLSQGFEAILIEDAIAEQISGSHMTLKRRADIVDMKLKLWKMGLI